MTSSKVLLDEETGDFSCDFRLVLDCDGLTFIFFGLFLFLNHINVGGVKTSHLFKNETYTITIMRMAKSSSMMSAPPRTGPTIAAMSTFTSPSFWTAGDWYKPTVKTLSPVMLWMVVTDAWTIDTDAAAGTKGLSGFTDTEPAGW